MYVPGAYYVNLARSYVMETLRSRSLRVQQTVFVTYLMETLRSRSAYSWFFEVLPIWLLALQALVAIASHGDVNGRSDTPLFWHGGKSLRERAGKPLCDFLGRWSIQERYNIDEFMEGAGLFFCGALELASLFHPLTLAVTSRVCGRSAHGICACRAAGAWRHTILAASATASSPLTRR